MPRPNIAAIRGQTDFQKTYYWNLSTLSGNAYFPIGDARLNMLCTSTEIPRYEGETAIQMVKGYQILDPGIYKSVGTMTLTFVEMIDSQIRNAWDTWMRAMFNKPDLFNTLALDFRLATSNNQEAENYEYNMRWC